MRSSGGHGGISSSGGHGGDKELGRPWRDRLRHRGPSPRPGLYGWSHTTPPKRILRQACHRNSRLASEPRTMGLDGPRTAGLDGPRTAVWISPRTTGLSEPRMAAGWSEPRKAAG